VPCSRPFVATGETALRVAEDVRATWRAAAARGEPVDVHRDMAHATLRVVAKAVLGTEISADADVVGRALGRGLEAVIRRIYAFVPLPVAVPTPANLDLRRATRDLHSIARQVIDRRRQSSDRPDDLLTVLIDDPDRDSGPKAERQLRDEIVTFLLAGHETTANALTWTWHCLACHPEVAARLRADLERTLGGRPPTVEDLPQLDGARMALQEAMRLYPPVWAIDRRTVESDVVGGYRIRAGTMVIVSPYVTHRHSEFWDEPERFDPTRFAPGADADRPRFAYLPFGGGPRGCIGGSFALLEGTLMLAALLPHFELSPAPGHSVALDPSVTLRPRGPVMMTVREVASAQR
jgi:cytochrome P450